MPRDTRQPAVRFERVPYDPVAWEAMMEGHPDVEVFHGADWLEYLERTQGAEPVVAGISVEGQQVGHFVGAIVRRYRTRILGSPLPGWMTQRMGFLLDPGVDRRLVAQGLPHFAFHDLGCSHLELADRSIDVDAASGLGYRVGIGHTFRADIRLPEEQLFRAMRDSVRWEIRRARRQGLTTQTTEDPAFADEFYAFLRMVFALRGLAPPYPLSRVHTLIETVGRSGHLRLLRVLSAEGETLATTISAGRARMSVALGVAFDRSDRRHHPIELAWWETMRQWQDVGAEEFDFAGGGDYKLKYGGRSVTTAHLNRSRFPGMPIARSAVERMVHLRQSMRTGAAT